ncbi:MAG: hypothetical protein JO287_01250 [Pseudonocardiales bacterium]|nr:hypothetical protein [Pseudonocardiales bacterium]
MPSRIGTATLAVFVTAHGPATDGDDEVVAHAAVPANVTATAAATDFFNHPKALSPNVGVQVYLVSSRATT